MLLASLCMLPPRPRANHCCGYWLCHEHPTPPYPGVGDPAYKLHGNEVKIKYRNCKEMIKCKKNINDSAVDVVYF